MCKVESIEEATVSHNERMVQMEKGANPEVHGFSLWAHCVTSQRKVNVETRPKETCLTQRTIQVDIFLHHLGVIGSSFTEVEFHAFCDVCIRVSWRGVAIAALRHEPFQNAWKNPANHSIFVFVNIGWNLPPVYLQWERTSVVYLFLAACNGNAELSNMVI